MTSINELFNSWINWPESWEVDVYEEEVISEKPEPVKKMPLRSIVSLENLRQSKFRARRARSTVRYAVQCGKLVNLKLENVKCVDCGNRATSYEHRDYTKPLEVEPVCNSCNMKRGPAKFKQVGIVKTEIVSVRVPQRESQEPSKNGPRRANKKHEKSDKQVKLERSRVLAILQGMNPNKVNITLDKKCHS